MVWGGRDFLSCNDEKRFVTDEPGFSNKILSRGCILERHCSLVWAATVVFPRVKLLTRVHD